MTTRTFWIATIVLALAALGTTLYATQGQCAACLGYDDPCFSTAQCNPGCVCIRSAGQQGGCFSIE